jgi:hypothetical protein
MLDPQYLLTTSIKAVHLAAESLNSIAIPESADDGPN